MDSLLDAKTISWIFLATAPASQISPNDFQGISMIADAVNHAVATHKELQRSLSWLLQKGFVEESGNKYSLAERGRSAYGSASANENTLPGIWKVLEEKIRDAH